MPTKSHQVGVCFGVRALTIPTAALQECSLREGQANFNGRRFFLEGLSRFPILAQGAQVH